MVLQQMRTFSSTHPASRKAVSYQLSTYVGLVSREELLKNKNKKPLKKKKILTKRILILALKFIYLAPLPKKFTN